MISQYYDPYRSVPEINKGYYSYAQQQQQQQQYNQMQQQQMQQLQMAPATKWSSQYQVNQPQAQQVSYIERDSSQESNYSNNGAISPKVAQNPTPVPKKMLTSSFAEKSTSRVKNKSKSPTRIYKTHSDLTKEKERTVKKSLHF